MGTKTAITKGEARKGDLIRHEWDEREFSDQRAVEVVYSGNTGNWYSGAQRHFLLDRPKKLIHAKGKTLWFKEYEGGVEASPDGHEVVENYYEDDRFVRVRTRNYPSGAEFYPHRFTDVKPRVLKWAKGTTLWLNQDFAGYSAGFEATVMSDHHEDDYSVNVSWPAGAQFIFAHRFTDIKPDPHPVGAIRWVTEDHDGAYGVKFRKGDRVTVVRAPGSQYRDSDVILEIEPPQVGSRRVYGWRKFLSATEVEPEPTIVAVPLPAIEKLRDAERHAKTGLASSASRSLARGDAIDTFLDTREVKTALREEPW